MTAIAYLRVSTLTQDLESQRHEIKQYSQNHNLKIDQYFEVEMSSRQSPVLRRMHELQEKLQAGDILISVELSRLGRNLAEVVQFVDNLLKKQVRLILINNGIDTEKKTDSYAQANLNMQIGMFSIMARLERDLISIRTKEGLLAAKLKGNVGGRRKGTIYLSKYDKHLPKIQEYLQAGHGLKTIIRLIGEGHHVSLSDYLSSRNIRSKKTKAIQLND